MVFSHFLFSLSFHLVYRPKCAKQMRKKATKNLCKNSKAENSYRMCKCEKVVVVVVGALSAMWWNMRHTKSSRKWQKEINMQSVFIVSYWFTIILCVYGDERSRAKLRLTYSHASIRCFSVSGVHRRTRYFVSFPVQHCRPSQKVRHNQITLWEEKMGEKKIRM